MRAGRWAEAAHKQKMGEIKTARERHDNGQWAVREMAFGNLSIDTVGVRGPADGRRCW